ncbi:cytochrome c [Methylorubrum sp. SB2]|uniref:SorB family sulfite dehydrogenase c-type cytochrome subunit n=1 Tax=Methylorubrum TaxID=2282523 RepID=UPI00313ACFF4
MTRITLALAAALALALATGAALAAPKSYEVPEPTATLRAPKAGTHAEGFEAAQTNCLVCHSVDYIAMQPPGKGVAFWESEVTKMVKVYHAPIDEAQTKAIAAYLAETY